MRYFYFLSNGKSVIFESILYIFKKLKISETLWVK
jgi:hypothetical protein